MFKILKLLLLIKIIKRKLYFGLQKAWKLSALLILISVHFRFHWVNYSNFCSFKVWFIYWWCFVVVLRVEDYFT